MTKRQTSLVVIAAILLIVFNVIIFLLPVTRTSVFWIADAFAIVAIILQPITYHVAYNKTETLMSRFYGFPVVRVGYYYLIAQLFASCIFVLLSSWIPVWLSVIVCIVLFAAAITGIVANDNTRDIVEAMDEHHSAQTDFMKRFYAKSKSIADTASDRDFQKRMLAFAENIKYSDSVSSPDLGHIEHDMWTTLNQLETSLKNEDVLLAAEELSQLDSLLLERNNLCKLYKKRSTDQGTPMPD